MRLFRLAVIIGLAVFFAAVSCQRQPALKQLLVEEGDAASADGILIQYKLYGKGEISLVFVHGWCTSMKYWDRQIPSFGVNSKVVTLDLAGHGRSGGGRSVYTMQAFGQDVAAVVEKLDLKNIVLIGHGMGGPVILEAAVFLSGRVLGLVGENTFTDLYMKGMDEDQIQLAMRPYQENFQEQLREHVRLHWFSPKSDHDLMSDIIRDMVKTPEEVALSALEELQRYDGTESLKQVGLDVRCIQTTHENVTWEVTRAHAKSIWVEYLKDLGHFIMLEDPPGFNRLLAGFINEFATGSTQKKQ